jgi:hypothetical protein
VVRVTVDIRCRLPIMGRHPSWAHPEAGYGNLFPLGRGLHRSATQLQSCFAMEKAAMCFLVAGAWLCLRRHVQGCRAGFAAMENFVAMAHSTLSGVRALVPACCRGSEIQCVQMRITKVAVRRTDPPHKCTYAHGCSCDAAYVVPPLFSVRSFRSE